VFVSAGDNVVEGTWKVCGGFRMWRGYIRKKNESIFNYLSLTPFVFSLPYIEGVFLLRVKL
jgi:hypothetical protein